jgi:predicted HicB family RNase H-like nuclease
MSTYSEDDEELEVVDNLDMAMEEVAETLELTRATNTGSKPGEPASKQVLLRASAEDHQRWKDAAAIKHISMAEFIRDCCNAAANELLECSHPTNMRRYYPWATDCLQCGQKWVTEGSRKPRAMRGK